MQLRMEDVDESRSRLEFAELAMEDLAWLGMDWDGDVVWQTHNQAGHDAALESLQEQGLVYPCVCTRKDIERAASAPHREDGGQVYPGTCRDRFPDAKAAWRATGREPAWRFRSQGQGVIRFVDGLLGERSMDLENEMGDFVVWTKAGRPAYQLAVVVDDAAGGIRQVVRGADLTESTFAQLALYRALGHTPPSHWHLGLVQDPQGDRLAKRTGAHSMHKLRESGVAAEELVQWAAQSLGMVPQSGLARAHTDHFQWQSVSPEEVMQPAEWSGA